MKKMVRIRHSEIYCNTTRGGALEEAAEEIPWNIIASCRRTNKANIGSKFAQLREDMMDEVGNPEHMQKASVDNREPNAEGR
jgi:hypothetical protein